LGGVIGHGLCSAVACAGGKLLATQISERKVTFIGGVLFLIFGVTAALSGVEEVA